MKYLTSTYLKDVELYQLSMFVNEDYCICVKKIKRIKEPFILNEDGKNVTIIDNGYYILEYIPFVENYICRIHIDNDYNIIERFYVATKNNCMNEGVPTFSDLKLSYVCIGKIRKIYNDEICKKELDKEDYDLACETIDNIAIQIDRGTNYIYNKNLKSYIM